MTCRRFRHLSRQAAARPRGYEALVALHEQINDLLVNPKRSRIDPRQPGTRFFSAYRLPTKNEIDAAERSAELQPAAATVIPQRRRVWSLCAQSTHLGR
jgi:hypothetical protein